jgi:hypothetical protein
VAVQFEFPQAGAMARTVGSLRNEEVSEERHSCQEAEASQTETAQGREPSRRAGGQRSY